jgi:Do/DeqQ family serine protease
MRWLIAVFFTLSIGSGLAQQPAVSGPLAHSLNDAFAGVYEKVAPAVVVIEAQQVRGVPMQGLPEGLQFFFQPQQPQPRSQRAPVETNQGSGFIISQEGYIITNNHVVEGAVEDGITVTLKDGRKMKAQLIGLDDKSDIAVLKVDGPDLPVAELADSDNVKVGQFAFAIGAPFDLPYTFTVGVVSAKGRSGLMPTANRLPFTEEFIQTDASINPGNSGGPLCDIDGKIVGINTMISGMNRGLGFAVPINLAKDVAEQLINQGRVSRPWLGLNIEDLRTIKERYGITASVKDGVLVTGIFRGTPAYTSDLQQEDIIVEVDDVAVATTDDLRREILTKKVGQAVKLDVIRGDQTVAVSVQTAEQPTSSLIRAANRRVAPDSEADPAPQPRKAVPRNDIGYHGLAVGPVGPEAGISGARVTAVEAGSPAEMAGLQVDDIVTEAGSKSVKNSAEFEKILEQADLSRGIMVVIVRNGETTFAILKQ